MLCLLLVTISINYTNQNFRSQTKMPKSNIVPLEEDDISQSKKNWNKSRKTFTLNREHLMDLRRIRKAFIASEGNLSACSAYEELTKLSIDLCYKLISETAIDDAIKHTCQDENCSWRKKANFYCEGCERYLCSDCGEKNEHECENDDE